jgi:hypothetical protein
VESIVSSQYENDIEHNLREEAFIDDDDASEDMLNILELFTILMTTCQFESNATITEIVSSISWNSWGRTMT